MIEEKDFQSKSDRKFIWKSLCCYLDGRALQFFSQLLISLIIIFFSIIVIFLYYKTLDCATFTVFITLISKSLS
jgi:hypothetical protein